MLKQTGPVRFLMDARQSRFLVKVYAAGPLAKLGHNPTVSIADFAGEIQCCPEEIEKSSFSFGSQCAALRIVDDMNAKDRVEAQTTMLNQVLEAAEFPLIRYQSTEISATKVMEGFYRLNVLGKLSLHGVDRAHGFTAQVAFVGDSLRASGDFALLQTDYNIKLYAIAAGALRLKDELKFTFDIVARKSE